MKTLLKITGLKVARGKNFLLNVPKLEIQAGKILGVAGPNGSGKTTLLEAISGLLKPDDGEILVAGLELGSNLRQSKVVIGLIPDDDEWFIPELTAREYLKLLAKVYEDAGKPVASQRIKKLAKHLMFSAFDQRLDTLSHGNKKKVQLIAGLMHEPQVIIVDELRNGLDPLAIIAAEQLVRQEAARGAAIIAASHDLWWVERVTDELILLKEGRVLVQAPTKDLVRKYSSLENLFIRIGKSGQRIYKA